MITINGLFYRMEQAITFIQSDNAHGTCKSARLENSIISNSFRVLVPFLSIDYFIGLFQRWPEYFLNEKTLDL